ncbi:MAG TPA: DNA mismatch repair protein MutS [Acetobacteraceae bacterium]
MDLPSAGASPPPGPASQGASSHGASPAIAQWFVLKAENPDALLFLRMGDFYELFFADAEAAAGALDIALTRRGEHNGAAIPMCGVPVHAADAYLSRLIRRGYRVAVAEQMEPAKGRTGKGPLKRAVVRLVTPGTLTEDSLLEPHRPNLLLALARVGPALGAAWLDVSTGLFETAALAPAGLAGLLGRLEPAEILAPDGLPLGDWSNRRGPDTPPPAPAAAARQVAAAFGVASLDAFGAYSEAEAVAAAVALAYVQAAGAGTMPRLSRPQPAGLAGQMTLDAATRASLELTRARDGGTAHTLLAAVSRTLTAPGARLLAAWLGGPLLDPAAIARRQDGWCWLLTQDAALAALRTALRGVPDLARALGRLSSGRGAPRDMAAIAAGLSSAREAAAALDGAPSGLAAQAGSLAAHTGGLAAPGENLAALRVDPAMADLLARALVPAPPARLEDGGVIAAGFDGELDAQRALRDDSRRVVSGLTLDLAQRYGVASLKIRHHQQLGYVIEAPAAAVEKLRAHPELTMRQAMTNGARFVNAELADLDQRISRAADAAAARERLAWDSLVGTVLSYADALAACASALARLDVLQSCARLAEGGRWRRPHVTDDDAFCIRGGRHPVVEGALDGAAAFVPNDCDLSPGRRVLLLTGPNMAGKSTYLRQNALIAILAQAGLPVPAESAEIGVVDQVFSRVGAADDLARGRSTFMVEMTETAAILHGAGPRSLVIVDEIGRGTSTLDGLAIAWAVLEALHGLVRCRTVFATHFHELAGLAEQLPRLRPHTMRVKEWRGGVVFLHEVAEGAAGRSWGVHVAQLAGVPAATVKRAAALLTHLERSGHGMPPPLPLFAAPPQPEAAAPAAGAADTAAAAGAADQVREALLATDPDRLSPRDALELIYHLKTLAAVTPPQPGLASP